MIQQIQLNEYAPLDRLNTLRLPCTARFVAEIYSIHALSNILQSVTAKRLPRLILGGGSNLLLPNTLNALVIRPMLKGIRLLRTDGDRVIIEVMAGESWHQLVMETIARGWFGLENLALIPGTVGAAPVQNIGAYGVEIVDRLYSVQAMDRAGQLHDLRPDECQFAYRDSMFKQQDGEWVIVSVRFALSKKPQLVLGYGDVIQAAGEHPTPLSVANAIIHIRSQKLPDPSKIANAGSFFKNPCVLKSQFERLKAEWPQISGYPQSDGQVKLAAGWLIDQVGWKGRRLGGITGRVGMYEKQALVLVNYGGATSKDVLALSTAVQADVWSRFSVQLEREPVVPIGAYDESA